MEFFLRPENRSIWSQVQDLAHKGDQATLQSYVAEAQRLTSPLRLPRFPTKTMEVGGKSVQPGDVVIVDIVSCH